MEKVVKAIKYILLIVAVTLDFLFMLGIDSILEQEEVKILLTILLLVLLNVLSFLYIDIDELFYEE